MKDVVLSSAAFLGALAIVMGAFGAHALKKRMSAELLQSFETGVKYQMYHALALLVIGFSWSFDEALEIWVARCMLIGVILFSFSIYGLCLSAMMGKKWRFLGPITPIGGLFMVAGWTLMLLVFLR